MLGAYYPCYKQPKALIASIRSFRAWYPDTSLVVVCDNGFDYSKFVTDMNGRYIHCNDQLGSSVTNFFSSREKATEFLRRFFRGVSMIEEDYFMYLEDDVLLFRPVAPGSLKWDLTGMNRCYARLPDSMVEHLRRYNPGVSKGHYYGGCGGSIYRTHFVKEKLLNIDIEKELQEYEPFNPAFDSDILLSYLVLKYGGTVGGPPDDFMETHDPRYNMGSSFCITVLHQYKELYNKPLDDDEKKLLGWS